MAIGSIAFATLKVRPYEPRSSMNRETRTNYGSSLDRFDEGNRLPLNELRRNFFTRSL